MSVVIETTLGDVTVDLFIKERPRACLNFLKLCRLKYYNYNLFHTIQEQFIAQTGDPTGKGDGGESIFGVLEGVHKRYFEAETVPKIRHTEPGLLSMVGAGEGLIGSQFFFTLGSDLTSLDVAHCVIGEVSEGHEVLAKLNEAICDTNGRPYKDIRITHTVVLEDPFNDPRGFREPSRSPSPNPVRLQGGRIAADEDIDDTEGKTEQEINEMIADKEAKARATILEIVGDLPDAEMAPPENVLFVCKLNPVTTDDDLTIIFSRFGKIKNAEVIRDRMSGDSLQYAFIEFEEKKSCEEAYFKMDNVLIDDRRIHVDFSQSVSKIKWRGKGRWTIHEDDKEEKQKKGYNRRGHDEKSTDKRRRSKSLDRNRYRKSPERSYDRRDRGENRNFSRSHYRDERNRDLNRDRYREERKRSKSPKYRRDTHKRRSRSRSREDKRKRDDYRSEKNNKKKSKKAKRRSSSLSSDSDRDRKSRHRR